ncbi:alanine glycine permease [Pelobium manganitolerans]|uniref:Alanine glycine permease n=1 Tax=Pelobium manganitolerans TaxID=1842495 RepID=A0A419S3A1_9SPHI|nr:alanine/glycine:cation symporter family protein [Pelobium manganitolerans]RKD13771.1 alanine glycine permease [Pelobium manganitolerans]
MRNKLQIVCSTFLLMLIANTVAAAEGIDDKINKAFEPVANAWEAFVFTSVPLGDSLMVPIVLIVLIGGAVFFTLYFSFVNIRRFPMAIKVVQGKYDFVEGNNNIKTHPDEDAPLPISEEERREGEVSHFQALTAAVSGTVGLGNIAGVAVAIAVGGPGATFWLVVAGLLGMSSKFVECTLGVKYRDVEADGTVHGGPMYYLSKGFKELKMGGLGKVFALVFAVLCVGASFGGGNAFQSNQAVAQIASTFNLEGGFIKTLLGLVVAGIVAMVIIGGIKRIAVWTERLVPFMAGLYMLACLIIIGVHISYLPEAVRLIFSEAFSPSAGLGGFLGVLITGFRRAAFSNEAGVGSAAIAHSAVRTRYPASEGVVSLLEPFIDTVVICTMTALVIIFFNKDGIFDYGLINSAGNVVIKSTGQSVGGVDLTTLAFDAVIPHFSYLLTIAIVLFAFSTMISWSYYGLQAWKYLFGRSKASDITYKALYLVFVVIGAAATLDSVVKFSDAMILAMVVPNMIGLILLSPKVKMELERYVTAVKKVFKAD